MPCCFSHTGSLHGPQGSVAVTDVEECCPRRCTTVPEALGIYARNTRLTVPVFSGISAHVHGGMFFFFMLFEGNIVFWGRNIVLFEENIAFFVEISYVF